MYQRRPPKLARLASLDEERIELANAAVGRWMPARVKNMPYSHYFNVMCRMMCSGAVCAYFKKLRRRLSPEDPAVRTILPGWLVQSVITRRAAVRGASRQQK